MRVLTVEGGPEELRRQMTALRRAGWAVDGVRTMGTAKRCLVDGPYDAVVVSRRLSDGDGLALVEEIPRETGLLVIAFEGGTEERAALLEAGADDCVDPLADVQEVVARVARMLVRRTALTMAPVHLGRAVVDRVARTVKVDGVPVRLTATQLCVLDHLVAVRHRVATTGELLDHCWNSDRDLLSNPLPSQINRLRQAFRGVLEFRFVDRDGYVVTPVDDGAKDVSTNGAEKGFDGRASHHHGYGDGEDVVEVSGTEARAPSGSGSAESGGAEEPGVDGADDDRS